MQSVRGMHDILPDDIPRWHRIEASITECMRLYDYKEIRTPIVEYAELFYHGVGSDTDAVGKEMYVFPDRSGELLALRPELTASVARAIVEHALHKHFANLRLWYYGPCFRYERPQKGRQRQFHQIGAECLGYDSQDADVEIIALAWDIVSSLCNGDYVTVVLNTLGTEEEQKRYRERLVEYLERYHYDLSEISQQRLRTNPLRILDSKDDRDRRIIADAPRLLDQLSHESISRYETVKDLLHRLSIPFVEDTTLVRGLDYYTHTVFELRSTLLGAQDAVGGGGRYDNLIARLGGDRLPGVGFGIGVERLLLIENSLVQQDRWKAIVYIAATIDQREHVHALAMMLRKHRIAVTADLNYRSLKAQLRTADRMGYRIALLLGIPDGCATVKDMARGEQFVLPQDPQTICVHVEHLLSS
ncbi:MAG: histidine--tRNA ligase [Chlorobi bacterium]|nr:histidine--tRNA ligase [Chlorobiota bacterium]